VCEWLDEQNFGWFFRHIFKVNNNLDYQCAVEASQYFSEGDHTFDLNYIPLNDFLVELIGSAIFEASITFTEKDDHETQKGCLRMKSLISLDT
jgi:hypothetical protein